MKAQGLTPTGERAEVIERNECIHSGERRLRRVERKDSLTGASGSIFCWNGPDEIAYRLQGQSVGESTRWTLNDFVSLARDDSTPSEERTFLEYQSTCGRDSFLYRIEADWIEKIVEHPLIQIDSFETSQDGFVRLTFSKLATTPEHKDAERSLYSLSSATRGEIVLDPGHDYCIKSYFIEYDGSDPMARSATFTNEYVEKNGVPVPLSQTIVVQQRDGSVGEGRIEFEIYERDPSVDPAVFTLEHYGLTTPVVHRPGAYRTPAWLYWFVGGMLSIVAGGAAVYAANRRT